MKVANKKFPPVVQISLVSAFWPEIFPHCRKQKEGKAAMAMET